jgi:Zn finger protein HypA/HybF involved in hydrogenase expression
MAHGQWKHEQRIIDEHNEMGWEQPPEGEWPEWIDAPDEIRNNGGLEYKYTHYYGDTFVYRVVSMATKVGVHIFRKPKAEYFTTTPKEGTCPNCQKYVKRYDGDDHLTCHRCGWEYIPSKRELLKETDRQSGWCPQCERYIKRYEDDVYLTCHRCGWEYKTLKDALGKLFKQ